VASLNPIKTINANMAREITENVKQINSEDPLLYDFPLSRLGILKICKTKYVKEIWADLACIVLGHSITTDTVCNTITGLSISPKKNFCIVKIWMSSCKFQDASIMNIKQLKSINCIFKKH
jgi:hypothetical protein